MMRRLNMADVDRRLARLEATYEPISAEQAALYRAQIGERLVRLAESEPEEYQRVAIHIQEKYLCQHS